MIKNKDFNFNNNFWNFLYLYKKFSFYFIFLLNISNKIIFRLKYGLYYYFFWLKVGCKNYFSRKWFSVFFFLDFIFSGLIAFKTYNYALTSLKYKFLPSKKSVYTISKGPMVRKKQSREQFIFKQMFITVKKVISVFDKSKVTNELKLKEIKDLKLIKSNQLNFLYNSFINNKKINFFFFFLKF